MLKKLNLKGLILILGVLATVGFALVCKPSQSFAISGDALMNMESNGTDSETKQNKINFENELLQKKYFPMDSYKNSEEKEINFPDENLETAVKTILKLDENEAVTSTNILNLESIVSNSSNIYDLSGLEYAKNLQKITFSDNLIKSLEPLKQLEHLYSVGFANNPNLKIDEILSLNYLTEIDLSGNADMGDFSKLAKYENLTALWLNECNLMNIEFVEKMSELIQFQGNNNKLTNVDSLNSEKLRGLWLDNNNIRSLAQVGNISNVERLWINGNQLDSLDGLNNFSRLNYLYANSNNILTLEGLSFPVLIGAELDNNQIQSLNIKEAPLLFSLVIRHNELTNLNGLENSPKLGFVNATDNKLRDIISLEKSSDLYSLTVQDNPTLENFAPLKDAPSLKSLYALNTNMNDEKLNQLGKMKELDLLAISNTKEVYDIPKVTSLDFIDNFPKLTGLGADGHSIANISKVGKSNLKTYSFINQTIDLPQVNLGQSTKLNLLGVDNQFPEKIEFITLGEIVNEGANKTVKWNQVGNNSLKFSDLSELFSGTIYQDVK